jgi:hypothetical protein
MKNKNHNSANQLNSLIWIKRSNYKQKSGSGNYSIHRMDLSWIKVSGYSSVISQAEMFQIYNRAYNRINLLKAQHRLYSVAIAVIAAGLLLVASIL